MKRLLLTAFCGLFAAALFSQDYNIQFQSHLPFPGEECANICGYAINNHEYALVGTTAGMRVVDVTDPENPFNVKLIPGNTSDWREIKVFNGLAYVTTEADGGGLQIVDLTGLPNDDLPFTTWFGDGDIQGRLSRIHALHIDEKKGFIYLYGTRLAMPTEAVGCIVADLKPDPKNPIYAGRWQVDYIHDGYVDNDTLYGGHINAGYFSIIDFTDKSAPNLLASTKTPHNFTHNTWITKDRKHILTTDEKEYSFLTSYDVSDPSNIQELDRIQPTPGSGSIVHNTHILGDFAITSWYKDGVTIVDCSRPGNLVQTAWYDAYTGTGGGFNGTWGVYPFLPSGNLILSNIEDGLYVLSPTYVKACFLEGKVTNSATGTALNAVEVALAIPNFLVENTKGTGLYATGYHVPGTYDVTFSKAGFISKTVSATLVAGEVTLLDVQLEPLLSVSGNARDFDTQANLADTKIVFQNAAGKFETTADALGQFLISGIEPGVYEVLAAKWGWLHSKITISLPAPSLTVELKKGYQDDFFADLGWQNTFTATTGLWTLGEPVGTTNQGSPFNPQLDIPTDLGDQCYDTGNSGGGAADDDVDGGEVVLISPDMDLSGYAHPVLSFHYWFANAGGTSTPNDHFEARAFNGQQEVVLFNTATSDGAWHFSDSIYLENFLAITNSMTVSFKTADDDPGHRLEAAVDAFFVGEGKEIVGTTDFLNAELGLSASPNPFSGAVKMDLNLPENWSAARLEIRDLAGRLVFEQPISAGERAKTIDFGKSAGAFLATLFVDGQRSLPVKLMRI